MQEVLLKYGKWQLIKVTPTSGRPPYLMVTDGWYCDYPILYEGITIAAFDHPERLPNGLKDRVSKVMVKLRSKGLYPFIPA